MTKYDDLLPRFINYVKQETRSDDKSTTIPSSPLETDFANKLKDELIAIGVENVRIHPQNQYVLGTLKSNLDYEVPAIGYIAHIDTADFNAHHVNPQIIDKYDGNSDIQLGESEYVLDRASFPALENYVGHTLITTDGTTLLGADDKSGVSEIVTMAKYLVDHPEIKHGDLQLAFGPDEEIGTGADHFDVADFGADFAYTVDGGPLGELEYETFNAAAAEITIQGKDVHTATAKGVMINALQVAFELNSKLPTHDRPELTTDREGFFHLDKVNGTVGQATMEYIIRDHDKQKFNARKAAMKSIVEALNDVYGENRIQLKMYDQYYNMREVIEEHMEVVEIAKQAMEDLGIEPVIYPVRGGTDGSKISFMGLPTPNLFAGGENMHSRFEFVSLEVMKQAVDVLLKISELNVAKRK